jgi:hypothetical protein
MQGRTQFDLQQIESSPETRAFGACAFRTNVCVLLEHASVYRVVLTKCH